MTTTLVVGMGGTGVLLLRRLKALSTEIWGGGRGPFVLLGFDVARSGTREIRDSGFPKLDDDEFVWLSGRDARAALSNLVERRERFPWIPPVERWAALDEIGSTTAGSFRWLGRLSYALAEGGLIRPNVQASLRRLAERQGELVGKPPARIIMAGSLAGGMGSGMLVDLTLFLASLAEEAIRLCYLLLPQASFENLRGIWGNTYAALREIDDLETRPEASHLSQPEVLRRASPNPPDMWQRIYLFPPSESEEAPFLSTIDRMAQAVLPPLHPSLGEEIQVEVEHQILLVRQEEKEASRHLCFSTAAALFRGMPLPGSGETAARFEQARAAVIPEPQPVQRSVAGVQAVRNVDSESEEQFLRLVLKVARRLQADLEAAIRARIEEVLGRAFREVSAEMFQTAAEIEELCRLVQFEPVQGGGQIGTGSFHLDHEALKDLLVRDSQLAEAAAWGEEEHHELVGAGSRVSRERICIILQECFAVPVPQAWEVDSAKTATLPENWEALGNAAKEIFGEANLTAKTRAMIPLHISHQEARQNSDERATALLLILEDPDFRRDLRVFSLERLREMLRGDLKCPESFESTEPEAGPPAGSSAEPASKEVAQLVNLGGRETLRWPEVADAIYRLRRDVFVQRSAQSRRYSYALVLVPHLHQEVERASLRSFLQRTVQDVFQCRVRIIDHPGPELWIYYEDLFHAAADIRHLERFRDAYMRHPRREIFHLDYRLLGDPDFADLLDPPRRELTFCGNRGCQENIASLPRGILICPGCKALIRSRCGNPECEEDDLHTHPEYRSKTCPRCHGVNRGAWWSCCQHKGAEILIPIDKERCPDCILRHHEDPSGFPLSCISRRPDLRDEVACPHCLVLRKKNPKHPVFTVRYDLLPFYRDGVNGVNRDLFFELAKRYKLPDGYRCPSCCTLLIPVDRRSGTCKDTCADGLSVH